MKFNNYSVWLLVVSAIAAGIPYWIGVFSGWFAKHYGPITNSNPDAWIHASVMFSSILAVMVVRAWLRGSL